MRKKASPRVARKTCKGALVSKRKRLKAGRTSTKPALASRRTAIFAPRPVPISCHLCGVRTAYSSDARMFFPRRTFLPVGLSVVMRHKWRRRRRKTRPTGPLRDKHNGHSHSTLSCIRGSTDRGLTRSSVARWALNYNRIGRLEDVLQDRELEWLRCL